MGQLLSWKPDEYGKARASRFKGGTDESDVQRRGEMVADLDKSSAGPSNCAPSGKQKSFGIYRLRNLQAKNLWTAVHHWRLFLSGLRTRTGRASSEITIRSLCPVCGQAGAREWLRAPDRLHGRQEQYTLLRCPACSLVWLSKPPKPAEMHRHYTDAYDRLISAAGENSPRRWRDRNAALAPHKQSGALLDLGCSSGAFLQSLCGKGWDLSGIEMSAESAKQAQARSGANVFVGDILDAQFAAESFDVITCFDVFEHLYEPRRVMAKVAEWLKPGGIFYVLVPKCGLC